MEILKHFVFEKTKYKVHILWETEQPLFRLQEVADIIGMKSVLSIARYLSDDQKVMRKIQTSEGSSQEVLFLTETGLSRFLVSVKTIIGFEFQKWAANVISDIKTMRSYGVTEWNDEVTRNKLEIEELQRKLKEAEKITRLAMQNKKESDEKARLARHTVLLEAFHNKDVLYIARVGDVYGHTSRNGKILLKIGETDNIGRRCRQHVADYNECEFLHVIECPMNTKKLISSKNIGSVVV